MENRNGMIVNATVTQADGHAARRMNLVVQPFITLQIASGHDAQERSS